MQETIVLKIITAVMESQTKIHRIPVPKMIHYRIMGAIGLMTKEHRSCNIGVTEAAILLNITIESHAQVVRLESCS
ncbi:MAG: hypothetical protein M3530_11795 [Thermoproteota archaeon]|nr:hypothetical protein [Thermoproteota archaeon]